MNQEEHWRSDKAGNFGLMDVDVTNAYGNNVWNKIEMVIQAYAKVHPTEMKDQIEMNAMLQATRKNEFAQGKKLRWGVSIPAGLLFKLEQVEPNLFKSKKMLNMFMQKYKGFRVCKVV